MVSSRSANVKYQMHNCMLPFKSLYIFYRRQPGRHLDRAWTFLCAPFAPLIPSRHEYWGAEVEEGDDHSFQCRPGFVITGVAADYTGRVDPDDPDYQGKLLEFLIVGRPY